MRVSRPARTEAGFTIVEVMIVTGLTIALLGLTVVNLARPQIEASVGGSADRLVADLRLQQMKAMSGDVGSGSTPTAHGIRIQSGSYILFKGTTYNAGDTDNFTVTPDGGATLTTTLPSSQVVFAERSGEANGWTNGQNTITVRNGSSSLTKTITINRYGVVTVN